MTTSCGLGVLALTLAAVTGCTAHVETEPRCIQAAAEALYGASDAVAVEVSAELGEAQLAAIGALEDEQQAVACTATLIAPRWVLTAAHCRRDEAWFRTANARGSARLRVVRQIAHPTRDVLLAQLAAGADLSALGAAPIALTDRTLDDRWRGREAVLAGFGLTEQGRDGVRMFVREPVHEVRPEHVIVDGGGVSGACVGDSGGPLLDSDGSAPARILGVLSFGAASCTGMDYYERADGVRDWIAATLVAATREPCGEVTLEGSCEAGNAVFCDAGELRAIDCADGARCGYSLEQSGFRCVAAADDACAGLGSSGTCERDRLVQCERGVVREHDCAACGERCRRTRDGRARCMP